ncbi:MAG: STAS domain-containing protein [Candidatus Magnetomorum sp.]|nr:STAS domain-containing protein [Candidatus Magnetomorum sp.]
MEFQMDLKNKQGVIIIDGEISLQQIKPLKKLFDQAMISTARIMVDMDRATYIDLSFLQLLYAAQKKCLENKKLIIFKKTSLEQIRTCVAEAGFSHSIVIRHQ